MKFDNALMHIEFVDGEYVDIDSLGRLFYCGKPALWTDKRIIVIFSKASKYIDGCGGILPTPNWHDDCDAPHIWGTPNNQNIAALMIKYIVTSDPDRVMWLPVCDNDIFLRAYINGVWYCAIIKLSDGIILFEEGPANNSRYIFPSILDSQYVSLIKEFSKLIKCHEHSTFTVSLFPGKHAFYAMKDIDDKFLVGSYGVNIFANWEFLTEFYNDFTNMHLRV